MPGGNFAKGYHFVLAKGENTDPIISVYGTNINGYITKIDFNAKTKSYLTSYSKIPSESGLYEFNKYKKTINIIEKNNAVLGSVFTKDLSNQAVWGYEKPGTTNSNTFIRIKKIDSKENWKTLDINEKDIVDLWFSEQYIHDKKIYYTTGNAIKSYNTNNKQTKTLFQDLYQDNNILKIIHSSKFIAVLTKDHIYTSNNNGVNWDKVLSDKNISDIEYDENHNLYIKKQDDIYINNIDKNSKVHIPTLNEEINGYKIKNNFMYLYTSQSLLLIDLQTSKCKEYKLNKQINSIFLNEINPYELYVVNNTVLSELKINKGGDKFVTTNILPKINGSVSSVNSTPENLLISLVPNFNWKKGDIK